jgi:hypothetical protein
MQSNKRLQIVKRFPGSWTGQEFLETHDGTVWEVVSELPERCTGDRQGTHTDSEVFEL